MDSNSKKSTKFERLFKSMINEDLVSGDGGVFGSYTSGGTDIGNSDDYAPGDSRIPKALGGVHTRRGKISKKKKKNQKKVKKSKRNS